MSSTLPWKTIQKDDIGRVYGRFRNDKPNLRFDPEMKEIADLVKHSLLKVFSLRSRTGRKGGGIKLHDRFMIFYFCVGHQANYL